jgi:hypothetical protein
MEQEDMEQELFGAVAQLTAEFGNLTVIVAIQRVLEMEVEENGCCVACQRKAGWWHRELSRLLTKYQGEFPEIPAVARINSPMPGLVQ